MTDEGQDRGPEPAGSEEEDKKAGRKWGAGKITLAILGSLVILFLLIQLLPIGRDHTAPQVTAEANWPSLEAKTLARGACYDCHSNETNWPWYSNIVPISVLVSHDVDEARSALNFSEWDRPQPELREVTEAIGEGSMPPDYYRWTHPAAKLTAEEQQQLIAGVDQLWATDPPPSG